MSAPILLAEDDPDDRFLLINAVRRSNLPVPVQVVGNGEELMDYLHRRGAYAGPGVAPRPSLILLDLNMPRKDGREALREIKSTPDLRPIPVVVLTTSRSQQDIDQSYDLGVNAFLSKPNSIDDLTNAVQILHDFWFRTVRLPA
jgi:two-component system response regulator